jgi:hypothetical protein
MDWAMDDQPIWMRTRAGPILSVPYPLEMNDSPALVCRRHTGRQFGEMVIDQFDEMLDQSRKYPLVFAVSVHLFIIGKPFRLRAFRDALRHIVRYRDRPWITIPGEIALMREPAKKAPFRDRSSAWQRGPIPGHCVIAIAAPSVTIDNTVLSSTVALDSLE